MRDEDHERLADKLDDEADKLGQRNQELGQKIEDVRTDWHAKQDDEAVPGAPPRPDEDREQSPTEGADADEPDAPAREGYVEREERDGD